MLGKEHSSGFPGKNIFPILGRPMMAYPIMAALQSKAVDRVYVSTDSDTIKGIAKKYGALTIDRPAELCTTDALSEDAYYHGLRHIEQVCPGQEVEIVVLLMANAVTIRPETIDEGVEKLLKDPSLDSAVTVSCYNMWSPLRARRIGDDGLLHPFVPIEAFGDPATLSSDRRSQGDAWFADMGVSIIRPRNLEDIDKGLLPQKWMGQKIYPLKQWGGVDVDYDWQVPHIEHWLQMHGVNPADQSSHAHV